MLNNIRCFLIDDERPSHDVLNFHIAKVPWLEIAGSYFNAIDALEALEQLKPDLLFLDVNMPELSGVELLDILSIHKPQVILTTAYPEYAIDGFKYDVTAFLLKPISFDRFFKAVNKVRSWQKTTETGSLGFDHIQGGRIGTQPKPAPPLDRSGNGLEPHTQAVDAPIVSPKEEKHLWVRSERKLVRLLLEDILYVEGLKDYVKIFHREGMLITHGSVAAMEEQLPANQFLRVHRSYIVNRGAVKVINGNTLVLTNNQEVTITPQHRDEIIKKITGKS
jgi:two-component system, LytTR family, response regulator